MYTFSKLGKRRATQNRLAAAPISPHTLQNPSATTLTHPKLPAYSSSTYLDINCLYS